MARSSVRTRTKGKRKGQKYPVGRYVETYGDKPVPGYTGPKLYDIFPKAASGKGFYKPSKGVTPIREDQSNAYALVGLVTGTDGYGQEIEYSANPADYWDAKDSHVFTEQDYSYSSAEPDYVNLDLAWMGYDKEGRYTIYQILKPGYDADDPDEQTGVTVADLRKLPVK